MAALTNMQLEGVIEGHTTSSKAGNASSSKTVPTSVPASMEELSQEEFDRIGKRVTLKLDVLIFPWLAALFMLNFLDRQNLPAARLADIEKDLNLTEAQFQTCVGMFFAGYIVMQVPSNMILGRVKQPGTFICISMILRGMVGACTTGVDGFAGLAAIRFFAGSMEGAFFPGTLYYLSLFYSRQQYAFRVAILYSGSQLGNALSGIYAIGVLALHGKYAHEHESWRWLFLIAGISTIAIAFTSIFILPNSTVKILGMSEAELTWIQNNQEQSRGAICGAKKLTALQGFHMALSDPKVWLIMATTFCIMTTAAVVNWFPSVVAGLGKSRNETLGLTVPPFVLCIIVMLLTGLHSDMKQERYLHIAIPMSITLVANIMAVSTVNVAVRYVAMILLPASCYTAGTIGLAWLRDAVSQPLCKRAAAIALVVSVVNTPNVWSSYLYFEPPRYLVAFLVNLGAAATAMVLATLTKQYLRREDRKVDRDVDLGQGGASGATTSLSDTQDGQWALGGEFVSGHINISHHELREYVNQRGEVKYLK